MSADSEPVEEAPLPHEALVLGPTTVHKTARSATGHSDASLRRPQAALGRPARRTPPISGWRSAYISLANRDFLLLWLGMLFTMSGLQMQMLARSYLVYDITESGKILGLVSAAGALPMLSLALFGGAIADRIDRKRLIQAGQVTSTVISLLVALSITLGWIVWTHLLIAALVQGVMWAFLVPARQAIIPQLVGRENLGNAVALQGAGMSATTLAAPPIAGMLYAVIGPEGVYYIISLLGLASVMITTLVRTPAAGDKPQRSKMLAEIGGGLSYILRSRLIMALLAIALATAMLAMPIRFLLPVFVADVYQKASGAYGLLIGIMGVGSLIGSLAIASLGTWKRGLLLIIGTFASGVALVILAAIPLYYAAVGMMVLLGLGDASRRTLNLALLMEQVDDKYLGRITSVYMMTFGMMSLAILPAGFAIDRWGIEATIWVMGVLMLGIGTLVVITQKKLRGLQ